MNMRKSAFLLLMAFALIMSQSCKKTQIVDPPEPTNAGYKIHKLGDIENQVELPCFINIMFQVTDMDGNGVADLTQEDFEVLEDELAVSPSESAMQIRKQEVIPYRMRTVLMLDNSYSIGNNLSEIKAAAKSLVNNKLPRQEIAVFSFSEEPSLVIDFTDDINVLNDAINSIQLGYATTNLYGAVIDGVNHWSDQYQTEEIEQGFMVLFTDGSDTQASHTLSEALEARGEKKVYAVGLGSEIEPSVLKQIGNAGSYAIENVSELTAKFEEIQNEMAGYANSFYWLNYMTPKRGDFNHTLKLRIKDNPNRGSEAYIEGFFNSKDFYSVMQGLYVNASPLDDDGIDEIEVAENDTVTLVASSYLGYNPPSYMWESSNANVKVEYDPYDNSIAKAIAIADSGQQAIVTVRDLANDLTRTVTVKITKATIPSEGLIANYTFNGGNTDDQWANFHGTSTGTHPTTDRFGNENAIALDGINDKIEFASPILMSGSKAISFWVRPNELGRYQMIMTNSYNHESLDAGISVVLTEQNTLSVQLGNESASGFYMDTYTSSTLSTDSWYHVVVNYGDDNLKIWIDNEVRASTTAYNGSEVEPGFNMLIGATYQPLQQYLNADLDDLRFYNRALTVQEIGLLFNENR
jgi:VWFA-related protein